jgi:predicted DNA-binding transcriptional regulator AlpA
MSKRKSTKPSKAQPLKLVGEHPPSASSKNADFGRLLSRQEVVELVGASYVSIWSWIRQGRFPPGRSIGPEGDKGRVAWLESEIREWMESLPKRIPKPLEKKSA